MLKILRVLFPVKIESTIIDCPPFPQTVPGIGAAVLYATGDAFGRKFVINVPRAGTIHAARFIDKDDEGVETDLVMFRKNFTDTADNAAFDVSDDDLQDCLGTITFATFKNFTSNQMSTAAGLAFPYLAPEGKLYCQMVTRGGPTIAADNSPMVQLTISQEG